MSEMVGSTVSARSPRRPRPYNAITGLVGATIGVVLGLIVGSLVARNYASVAGTDQNDVAIVLAFLLGTAGWLGGLGFFRYPLARVRGLEPSPYAEDRPSPGLWRYFELSTDNKVVGIQYLVTAVGMFFFGGVNALMLRAELLYQNGELWTQGQYLTIVGIHSSAMILTMSSLALGGFGNYLVPLMIGARRTALPRLQALGFWLFAAALLILVGATFIGGWPTGWTGYAPLSIQARMGMDAYLVTFALASFSLMCTGIDLLVTVVTMRAPGLTWRRLPIFCWAVLATSLLMCFATPLLTAPMVMALMDRTISTAFFVPGAGGSPYLWQNLFWYFGHPEVYVLAIPAMGLVLEIIPVFARKTLWGYKLGVIGLLGIALLSFLVWQHHLFVSGINADVRPFYSLATETVSFPTGFIWLVALGTIWRARLRFTSPMLFALAFFFNFLIGGITGVYLADVASNVSMHGSYFVMAHFHYTIMGGLVFAVFGALYYWTPLMSGLQLSERLAKWHFWTMFVFFNSTFLPLFAVGALGMPRRVTTYDPGLHTLNIWSSISSFLLGASMLLFLINVVWSLVFKREPAEQNPWDSRGLEWNIARPIPTENFDRVPRFNTDPYRYGEPEAPPVADLDPEPEPAPSAGGGAGP
jgi:cytochrome c oxidase subunit I